MNNLMGSLGLETVKSDPNQLPEGRYAAEVRSSNYVYLPKQNVVAHVINYQVTEGSHKGAQPADFFRIGKDVVFADGHEGDVEHIVSHTPVMTDQNKQWYKKRFVDLGIPEDKVHETPLDALVGKKVTVGIKVKDGYSNVSFVELRNDSSTPTQSTAVEGLL